jgi:hypothetical protein
VRKMIANVGTVDQAVRVVAGLVLIAAALFSGLVIFDGSVVKYGAVVVGVVLAATGLMRTCPMYSILNISTRKS